MSLTNNALTIDFLEVLTDRGFIEFICILYTEWYTYVLYTRYMYVCTSYTERYTYILYTQGNICTYSIHREIDTVRWTRACVWLMRVLCGFCFCERAGSCPCRCVMSCVSPSGGEHCRRSQCNVAHRRRRWGWILSRFGVHVLWFLTTCAGGSDVYHKTLEYCIRISDCG